LENYSRVVIKQAVVFVEGTGILGEGVEETIEARPAFAVN
jgi:hypothetical protein